MNTVTAENYQPPSAASAVPLSPEGESHSGFALFTPGETGYPQVSDHWCITRDGDLECYALYRRHYSSRKNAQPKQRQFVGPGDPMVLIISNGLSLFVWLKQQYRRDGQTGINCAVFRNEGRVLSSLLINEAATLARLRWPGERLFTFVDATQVRHKRDPGRCFVRAGWQRDGESKAGLLIFADRAINANPPRGG